MYTPDSLQAQESVPFSERRRSIVLPLTTRFRPEDMRTTQVLLVGSDGECIPAGNPLAFAIGWLRSRSGDLLSNVGGNVDDITRRTGVKNDAAELLGDPAFTNVAVCVDSRGDQVLTKEVLAQFLDCVRREGAEVQAFASNRAHCAAGSLLTHVPAWTASSGLTSFLWHPPAPTDKCREQTNAYGWLGRFLLMRGIRPHQRAALERLSRFFDDHLPEDEIDGRNLIGHSIAIMTREPDEVLRMSADALQAIRLAPLVSVCQSQDEFADRLRRFILGDVEAELPPPLQQFVNEGGIEEAIAAKQGTRVRVQFIGDNVLLAHPDDIDDATKENIRVESQQLLPLSLRENIILTPVSRTHH